MPKISEQMRGQGGKENIFLLTEPMKTNLDLEWPKLIIMLQNFLPTIFCSCVVYLRAWWLDLVPLIKLDDIRMLLVILHDTCVLRDKCVVVSSGWFSSSSDDRSEAEVKAMKGTLCLCWGFVARGASFDIFRLALPAEFRHGGYRIMSEIMKI